MKNYLMALVALCMVSMVGCSSNDYSKNMRAATIQSSTTIATKAILDAVALEKYDQTKKMTIEISADLSKFLDDGKISDLPIDAAKDKIVAYMQLKGWQQYIPMVVGIIDIIEAQKVPIEKLGADNIALIKMGLEAAATSANTSKVEWRRQAK
jgi:hypothetical protein